MRYFVTGTTGFIGGVLARRLVEQGHSVVTVVRNPDKAGDLKALGVEVHRGDITDRATLRAPMTGADGVYHVAGWYKVGVRASEAAQGRAINVDGTRNVLEVMQELAIPKGVYTSTLAINSDTKGQVVDETYYFDGDRLPHVSYYDQTKWEAHYKVAVPMMKAGLPLVTVQPGVVIGPGDTSAVGRSFVQFLQQKLPVLPKGTTYTWAHVDDIVTGHMLAMDRGIPGEDYNICGEVHSLIDVMTMAERITGIPAPKIHAPPVIFRVMSAMVKPLESLISLPETYTSESLRVLAGVTYIASNAKAKRELGYNPQPLEQALRETLDNLMIQLGMK